MDLRATFWYIYSLSKGTFLFLLYFFIVCAFSISNINNFCYVLIVTFISDPITKYPGETIPSATQKGVATECNIQTADMINGLFLPTYFLDNRLFILHTFLLKFVTPTINPLQILK